MHLPSRTEGCLACKRSISDRITLPSFAAFSTSFSSSMTSIPLRQSLMKVHESCRSTRPRKRFHGSDRQWRHSLPSLPRGMYEEVRPFAIVTMSGTISPCSNPRSFPVRPQPHITSSQTNKIPYLSKSLRNP